MRDVTRGRTQRPRLATAGFTLLEVLVALAIFAAGVLAIIDLFSGSLRLSEGARDVSAAQVYASQRMEEALLAPNPEPGVESGESRWASITSRASRRRRCRRSTRGGGGWRR